MPVFMSNIQDWVIFNVTFLFSGMRGGRKTVIEPHRHEGTFLFLLF